MHTHQNGHSKKKQNSNHQPPRNPHQTKSFKTRHACHQLRQPARGRGQRH